MSSPYVAERQVEYWTSRCIEDYFLFAGIECVSFPLQALVEQHLPADFVFHTGSQMKLFGIQYKALYRPEESWHLDASQHAHLEIFPWIWYGLSELRSAQDRRNALHHLLLKEPRFPYSSRLARKSLSSYRRWGSFALGLQECTVGVRVGSEGEFFDAVVPALVSPGSARELERMLDVILVDYATRRAVRFGTDRSGTASLQ